MNRAQRTIIYLFLAIAILVQVGLDGARVPLQAILQDPSIVVSALVISFLAFRRGEVARQLLIGAALSAALVIVLLMGGHGLGSSALVGVLGFWCGSIVVSGLRTAKAKGAQRLAELDRAFVIVALPLAVTPTAAGLWLTTQILQHTYDNYFYAFDGLLPIPAARILAQFCAGHYWARLASTVVYYSFLVVLSAYVVFPWGADGRMSAQVLCRWIIATVLGYGLYYCLPGVGPGVAFYGIPEPHFDSLPSPHQVELTVLGGFELQPRNAMPSLHATWAFLFALMSFRMAFWVRVFGALYAMATVIVTLGLREHYLIDLVVAVPLTVAVHAGAGLLEQTKETKAHLLSALGGALMTVVWLLVIRHGTASLRNAPEIASVLVLATLAASAWLVFRREAEYRQVTRIKPDERVRAAIA